MVSLALQQVQGNVTEDRKVLRPLVFANATVVFPERPIQHPMQRIFHIPSILVVDRWAPEVEGSPSLDFLFLHDIWPHNLLENNFSNINRLRFYH
jgi:hypothetical protein